VSQINEEGPVLQIETPAWQPSDVFAPNNILHIKEKRPLGATRGNTTVPQAPELTVRILAQGVGCEKNLAVRATLWSCGPISQQARFLAKKGLSKLTPKNGEHFRTLRGKTTIECQQNIALFGSATEDGYRTAVLRCVFSRAARIPCKRNYITLKLECVRVIAQQDSSPNQNSLSSRGTTNTPSTRQESPRTRVRGGLLPTPPRSATRPPNGDADAATLNGGALISASSSSSSSSSSSVPVQRGPSQQFQQLSNTTQPVSSHVHPARVELSEEEEDDDEDDDEEEEEDEESEHSSDPRGSSLSQDSLAKSSASSKTTTAEIVHVAEVPEILTCRISISEKAMCPRACDARRKQDPTRARMQHQLQEQQQQQGYVAQVVQQQQQQQQQQRQQNLILQHLGLPGTSQVVQPSRNTGATGASAMSSQGLDMAFLQRMQAAAAAAATGATPQYYPSLHTEPALQASSGNNSLEQPQVKQEIQQYLQYLSGHNNGNNEIHHINRDNHTEWLQQLYAANSSSSIIPQQHLQQPYGNEDHLLRTLHATAAAAVDPTTRDIILQELCARLQNNPEAMAGFLASSLPASSSSSASSQLPPLLSQQQRQRQLQLLQHNQGDIPPFSRTDAPHLLSSQQMNSSSSNLTTEQPLFSTREDSWPLPFPNRERASSLVQSAASSTSSPLQNLLPQNSPVNPTNVAASLFSSQNARSALGSSSSSSSSASSSPVLEALASAPSTRIPFGNTQNSSLAGNPALRLYHSDANQYTQTGALQQLMMSQDNEQQLGQQQVQSFQATPDFQNLWSRRSTIHQQQQQQNMFNTSNSSSGNNGGLHNRNNDYNNTFPRAPHQR